MFSSTKAKLLLGIYVFIILSIPVGAYLVSQQKIFKTSADQPKKAVVKESTSSASISPAKQLQSQAAQKVFLTPKPSATPEPSVTTATSFGPTLSFKAILEGRPKDNQSGRMFVGIMEGVLTLNPKFLLSFTVDLPKSGQYTNLSLAGLTSGNKYTALLKGSAQIATSSAFVMSPTATNLNGGDPLTMLTGDLNEDNTVNVADYAIAKAVLGSTSKSANWNENADFNKDGVVNTFDLAIISKNLGQVGASGSWTSPLPKSATPSASLTNPPGSQPQGGQPDGSQGYWMWIPK